MILPLMNVTVIPFLLGATVSIVDNREWKFGPEYVFQLNKSLKVFVDAFIFENLTATVKCRPKLPSQSVENILFCHAYKITVTRLMQQFFMKANETYVALSPYEVMKYMPDQFFEVKFGMQGVQSFEVKGKRMDPQVYDVIPDIVEQFNMNIDLMSIEAGNSMINDEDQTSGKHVISSFIQTNEDTIRASKCNTTWIIEYTPSNHSREDREHQNYKNKSNQDFYLKLLPISYTSPADKTFLIQRTRMACIKHPEDIEFLNRKGKTADMIQYFNIIEIRCTKPKFKSSTHLEGQVLSPSKNDKNYFSENVNLELLFIRPAKNELDDNTIEYEHKTVEQY